MSLAELAYDKTAAIVGTVKDLLVNGYTKIKSFVASAREKSRTSRSRGRRGQSLSEDDSSSLDRYKTPMGRSKSRRGFSKGKVVPLDGPEMQEILNQEERKRHVNFNIKRVVQVGPIAEDSDYDSALDQKRSKSARSNISRMKTI